jgi:hypothetical protein
MSNQKKTSAPTPMTADAAKRVQASTAKNNHGKVAANSFAARALRTAQRNKK